MLSYKKDFNKLLLGKHPVKRIVKLGEAVQAYLSSRAEGSVPICSHYERDSFLREMIAIARSTLVALTESKQ